MLLPPITAYYRPITTYYRPITAYYRPITAYYRPITNYYRLLPLSVLETEQMSAVEIGLMSSLETRHLPPTLREDTGTIKLSMPISGLLWSLQCLVNLLPLTRRLQE